MKIVLFVGYFVGCIALLNANPAVKPRPLPRNNVPSPPPSRCKVNEFQCGDGYCIPLAKKCNGFDDCNDMSDESNCRSKLTIKPIFNPNTTKCGQGKFVCNNTQCVAESSRCNGVSECSDGSDEIGCTSTITPTTTTPTTTTPTTITPTTTTPTTPTPPPPNPNPIIYILGFLVIASAAALIAIIGH